MKKALFAILFSVFSLSLYADALLGGSPISSSGASQAASAFDNNANTAFSASAKQYGWVGMDFGRPYVLTIIGYTPPSGNAQKMLLGVFEGANRADFMDAVPLLIIGETPSDAGMSYARINCSRGFRYVRYVGVDGSYSSVAELQFYGDMGKGNDSHLCQLTNLPVVSIHTRDNQIPQDKVNEIASFITIVSNSGRTILADSATIRERGNYSRSFPKKPYRIKFSGKHNVLGAPCSAHKWTLINNYGDKTLMRNQLAFELSRRFGMPYTPFCAYVDVVLNGEYKGCYQLCDQIEVRPGRIDITEMKTTDNSGTALTGGYLVEADAYAGDEAVYFWSERGTPVTIKYPKDDKITAQQQSYIQQHYDKMEANPSAYLDYRTYVKHFLVGETSGNTDTYWSMYFLKQRGNDTLYAACVWDFDLAFENDDRTYPINSKSDYIYRSGGSTVGYLRSLTSKVVLTDPRGKQLLYDTWAHARETGLTEDNFCAYIDQQAALLAQSQRLNFLRWPIMNQYVHQNPKIWGSYEAEVDNVKLYIRERIAWMDSKLNYEYTPVPVVEAEQPAAQKILKDGQLYIVRDGKVYTPGGMRIK